MLNAKVGMLTVGNEPRDSKVDYLMPVNSPGVEVY